MSMLGGYIATRARVVAPGTVRSMEDNSAAFLRWADGAGVTEVEQLSAGLLEDFDASMVGRLAVATRGKRVHLVQRAWAWAHDREAFGGRTPRPARIDMPSPEPRPVRAPNWAQCDAMLHELGSAHARGGKREPLVYRLALLMRLTGLRVTQAKTTRRSHVDLDAGVLRVDSQGGTKTRAERVGRVVPLAPAAVDLLRGWQDAGGPWAVPGGGARTYSGSQVAAAWTRAGVPRELWSQDAGGAGVLHSLRRAFQTELMAAGADYLAVERLLGHALPGAGRAYLADRGLWTRMESAAAMVSPVREACALDCGDGDLTQLGKWS